MSKQQFFGNNNLQWGLEQIATQWYLFDSLLANMLRSIPRISS